MADQQKDPKMKIIAKMLVEKVTKFAYGGEVVELRAFGPKEDNTFASAAPSAKLEMTIDNPDAQGVLVAGKQYTVEFTRVREAAPAQAGFARVGVLALVAGLGVLLCGCELYLPKTKIKGEILCAPFSLVTPQNQSVQGLTISATRTGTNSAQVTVSIQSLAAVTDPNVVAATAAGQAQMLSATANLVQQSAAATQQLLQQLSAAAAQAGAASATGGVSVAVPKIAAAIQAAVPASTNAPAAK